MTSTGENFRANFTHHPLFWLAICFALGIGLASSVNIGWLIHLLAIITFAVFAFGIPRARFAYVLILLAFVSAGAFSYQASKSSEPKNSLRNLYDSGQMISGDPVEIEGFVEQNPDLAVGGTFFKVKAKRIFFNGKSKLVSGVLQFFAPAFDELSQREFEDLDLKPGTKIRVAAAISREERYLNPGTVSFVNILDQKGIDATGSIKSPLLIEVLDKGNAWTPFSRVFEFRQVLIEKIRSNFNVSTSGILLASLLGNQRHLTKETAEIFRDGGTFHILVISGLHVTFIGGIFLLFVRSFTRRSLLLFLIPTGALWIYAIAVGAEIPVVRAAIMFTVLLFSFVIHRTTKLLNSLGSCALLIFIWDPGQLFSQSFHLTFASLFGIVTVAFPLIEKLRSIGEWSPTRENPFPPVVSRPLRVFCELIFWSEKKWQRTLGENVWDCRIFKNRFAAILEKRGMQKPLRWIFEGILITVIVQLFLMPFLVVYFHRISAGSVVLNLWVSIFIVLQNTCALFALLLGQISEPLSVPFIWCTESFNVLLLAVPKFIVSINLASFRLPIYSGTMKIVYTLFYFPIIAIVVILNSWKPFLRNSGPTNRRITQFLRYSTGLMFALLFGVIVFHPLSSPTIDGKLTVDFLDVGQGDSALVTFPNGETMLIDGGGKHNFKQLFVEHADGSEEQFYPDTKGVGEVVVSEFLWEKGYSGVDHILATHADADHMQGLISVIKNFEIKNAMIGVESPETDVYSEFIREVSDKKIHLIKLHQGMTFEIGGVFIEVFNPALESDHKKASGNNSSVSIRMTYGARKFLFTGDIEKEAESELVVDPSRLRADVVKVAHHGSRTSSSQSFVEAANADYAVIPVGRKSPFGHPAFEVVDRWEASGAKVLMTGFRGTITISTNGQDLEVQTFLK